MGIDLLWKNAAQTALDGRILTSFGDDEERQQNRHLISDDKFKDRRCSEGEASTPPKMTCRV